MNRRWSPERKAFLVRDLVRDYCQVYEGLEEQRRRFDHEGERGVPNCIVVRR